MARWAFRTTSHFKKVSAQPRGFTIVELLIVVVVIAILAAITIVTYTGIQTRAENTRTSQAVAQFVKSLAAYSSSNGAFPATGASWVCVGTAPCGNLTDTGSACFSVGRYSNLASLDSSIQTISTISSGSDRSSDCGGKQYRGILYRSPSENVV